jgi:hypothetical protein
MISGEARDIYEEGYIGLKKLLRKNFKVRRSRPLVITSNWGEKLGKDLGN